MNILATTVTLTVGDPSSSVAFFTEHFGFREALSFNGGAAIEHPNGGPTLFLLRTGLSTLEEAQRHVLAQGMTLAFTVANIEEEVARLRASGVQPNSEIQRDAWGERHVQVLDPNGLVVQLVQWIGERPY